MVDVPRVTGIRTQTRALATPTQNMRVTPDDLGAAQGRAMERSGERLQAVGDRFFAEAMVEKREMDSAAAFGAYTRASEAARKRLMEGETAIYSRRGQQAMGSIEEAGKVLEEIGTGTLGELGNDDQKRAFNTLWQRRSLSEMEGVSRHVMTERRTYMDQTTVAVIKSSIADAENNYTDKQAVAAAFDTAMVAIDANGKGKSPDVIALEKREAASSIHKGIINRMLATGADLAADDYYKQNKKHIDGGDHAVIEKALTEGTYRAKGQAEEDRILSQGLGRSGALAEARKIADPKLRDETVRRVNTRYDEQERVRTEGERAVKDDAWKIVETQGYAALTPQQLAALDGNTLGAMERRDRQKKQGVEPVTNYQDFYKLDKMAGEDKEAFKTADLWQYRDRLDNRSFEHFSNLQRQLNAGDDKSAGYMSVLNGFVDQIYKTPSSKDANAEKIGVLKSRFISEVSAFQQENKRAPNPEELDKIGRNLIVKGATTKTIELPIVPNIREQYRFEAAPGEKFRALSADKIPVPDREAITRQYRARNNKNPSDAEVLSIYNKSIELKNSRK